MIGSVMAMDWILFVHPCDAGPGFRRVSSKAHAVSFKEAIAWTAIWVTLALLFNLGVWQFAGHHKALEFLLAT